MTKQYTFTVKANTVADKIIDAETIKKHLQEILNDHLKFGLIPCIFENPKVEVKDK